jgi:hypothetical protein
MRLTVKLTFLMLAAFSFLGVLLPAADIPAMGQAKEARPLKPKELVGVWVGFWQDEEFTRLDLRADFTGYCAYVAPQDSTTHQYGVHVYRVTRWALNGSQFNISLTPVDSHDENIYLKWRVNYLALQLEIGGTDRKWKEQVVLSKESQIEASNQETKNKIDEIEKR